MLELRFSDKVGALGGFIKRNRKKVRKTLSAIFLLFQLSIIPDGGPGNGKLTLESIRIEW